MALQKRLPSLNVTAIRTAPLGLGLPKIARTLTLLTGYFRMAITPRRSLNMNLIEPYDDSPEHQARVAAKESASNPLKDLG